MRKVYKILIVLLIIINIYSMVYTSNAMDIWEIGNKFLNIGQDKLDDDIFDRDTVNNSFAVVIDFLWGLGLLVVFISTVVLGIKYMLVMPNEKSRLKQATTPYIIGVVIIFGALTIWKLVIQLLEGSMLGG